MALLVMDTKIIAQPNNSLSHQATIRVMLALAAITFTVAFGFTIAGAWLVMPFAGLELLAFFGAFYYVYLHSTDFESIEIKGDTVVVEKKSYKTKTRAEFQRYWTKVTMREVDNGQYGMFIGSHGKELEFGKQFLNNEQRQVLVRELKEKLKSHNN